MTLRLDADAAGHVRRLLAALEMDDPAGYAPRFTPVEVLGSCETTRVTLYIVVTGRDPAESLAMNFRRGAGTRASSTLGRCAPAVTLAPASAAV